MKPVSFGNAGNYGYRPNAASNEPPDHYRTNPLEAKKGDVLAFSDSDLTTFKLQNDMAPSKKHKGDFMAKGTLIEPDEKKQGDMTQKTDMTLWVAQSPRGNAIVLDPETYQPTYTTDNGYRPEEQASLDDACVVKDRYGRTFDLDNKRELTESEPSQYGSDNQKPVGIRILKQMDKKQ